MGKNTPAYRIYCVPEQLERGLIDTSRADVRKLLKRPRHLRPNSFGYRGLSTIRPTAEGIRGTGETAEQELILLENGYLELSCPVRNSLFQWRKEQAGFADVDWLYPYAVVEMPASFLRVAWELYSLVEVNSPIRIGQEYRNIEGFVLVAGHPANPFFGTNWRDAKTFQERDLIGKAHVVEAVFSPEKEARRLILEVYEYFGFDSGAVPEIEEAWMYDRV
jgi:hypothetical protein